MTNIDARCREFVGGHFLNAIGRWTIVHHLQLGRRAGFILTAMLFDGLRREFSALATDKGLEFHVEECGDYVHSDPSLVEEMLRNLVSNAIKYTRHGWVRLQCLHEAASVRIQRT